MSGTIPRSISSTPATWLAAGSLLLLAGCATDRAPPAELAIVDATVVDVEAGGLRPGRTILVDGNRIVGVVPAATGVPEAIRVVDASGRYVVPGLWDAHVHSAASVSWHFPLLVAHGITSVRNMHTTVDTALELTSAIARRISSGQLLGPRFLANGPIIDGPPPSWPGTVTAATPEEGRAAVDSLASDGADFIKVYDNLSPETYRAIAAEARRHEIPVDGHVPFLVPAAEAAAAGQRTVEHASGINLGCSPAADSLRKEFRGLLERMPSMGYRERPTAFFTLVLAATDRRDPELCAETARAYREQGVTAVPTLVISTRGRAPDLVADSNRMALLPPSVHERWTAMARSGPGPFPEMTSDVEWTAPKNTELLHEAGVRILAGTDIGNPFLVPGRSLHDELELLVAEAGLSPVEALRAATLGPARTFGMADSLGTVAEGRLADLVLLEENPLEDIRATTSISGVVLDGEFLDRTELDALLAKAAGQ